MQIIPFLEKSVLTSSNLPEKYPFGALKNNSSTGLS